METRREKLACLPPRTALVGRGRDGLRGALPVSTGAQGPQAPGWRLGLGCPPGSRLSWARSGPFQSNSTSHVLLFLYSFLRYNSHPSQFTHLACPVNSVALFHGVAQPSSLSSCRTRRKPPHVRQPPPLPQPRRALIGPVSLDLSTLDTAFQWDHIGCALHFWFLPCHVCQGVAAYSGRVVDTPHFVYPFIRW